MEEIIGRYGGSVFQDSYFGIQLRGLAKPRNPQTQLQQLRRGDFGFLSASWRGLTPTEQSSWITEAGTVPEALRLFLSANVNLIISGNPTVTTFTSAATPDAFPMQINELTPINFSVQASSALDVVPADTTLMLYTTPDDYQSRDYINPSQYQPTINFTAGSDMATAHNIVISWFNRYGIMRLSRRICLKSVLVSTVNGARGDESIICATSTLPAGDFIVDSDGTFVTNSGGGYIIAV